MDRQQADQAGRPADAPALLARKRGSGWARSNKARVERLLAEGRMAEAGLARIEEAKRDGSWSRLDAVQDLVVPDDLADAFADHPESRERWDGLPRSVRRGVLEQIVQAKRPEIRARRVAETAQATARGEAPRPVASPVLTIA